VKAVECELLPPCSAPWAQQLPLYRGVRNSQRDPKPQRCCDRERPDSKIPFHTVISADENTF
jgi:hypothetical protein